MCAVLKDVDIGVRVAVHWVPTNESILVRNLTNAKSKGVDIDAHNLLIWLPTNEHIQMKGHSNVTTKDATMHRVQKRI